MIRNKEIPVKDAKATLLEADKVFGLGLDAPDQTAIALCGKHFGNEIALADVPSRIRTLVEARESARHEKQWPEADRIRKEVEKLDYTIEDTSEGPRLFKKG